MLNRLSPSSVRYDLQTLRGDVLGGVTAAVVGLPVALAFGLAAGLGPAAGIYGAIAVGFFAAVFGGTRSLISGPTGSMTVAMAVIVAAHADNIGEAFTIVILGGVVKLGYQTGDSLVSVIPAKAGIQNPSMPQHDLPMETPGFLRKPE